MAEESQPLFAATASSARQLHHLLRTVSFAQRVQVRITAEGVRFSAGEVGVLEAFIFLSSSLFTSFRLRPTDTTRSANPTAPIPASTETHTFSLPLATLLSTLQILTSTSNPDPPSRSITGPYSSDSYSSSFAAHRLSRHTNPYPSTSSWGGSAFSPALLGTTGQCRLVYRAKGSPLELSVPETGGVRTAAKLSTYLSNAHEAGFTSGAHARRHRRRSTDSQASSASDNSTTSDAAREGIPFDRTAVRLKAILPSSVLADALVDVTSLDGADALLITARRDGMPWLSLQTDSPAGGECRIAFGDEADGPPGVRKRSRLLETFEVVDLDPGDGAGTAGTAGEEGEEKGVVRARYGLGSVKKALLAARAGTKVSLRIDREGVLSLQFMVEVGEGGSEGPRVREEVAFVDFKIVPLWEERDEDEGGEGDEDGGGGSTTEEDV